MTSVGRKIGPDEVPDKLGLFHEIANGRDWTEAGFGPTDTIALCHDIRTYYEEAALELVDGPPPEGRAIEAWFFEQTEAGKTIMAARKAIKAQGGPHPVWFYMSPGQRR